MQIFHLCAYIKSFKHNKKGRSGDGTALFLVVAMRLYLKMRCANW